MTKNEWTCKAILDWTSEYLERKGDEHPRLSAEWLLSGVLGLSRIELYTNFDRPLDSSELAAMHAAIERRVEGEPLQYVTGETAFRHIVVNCKSGVLIPRPETELLVEEVLNHLSADHNQYPALVLEVGCGTGCVACSLARERAKTHVVTTDISPDAVALARHNRDKLGLTALVDVVGCDLATGVDERLLGHFDALVSNPPYIPSAVVDELPYEVSGFEPHLALDGGADGLDIYRRLLELAQRALLPGGVFAVELFETTLEAAAQLACEQGIWQSIEVHEDYTHRPRFLVAVRA
ncbi:peptide chain release factor N(5)-glutamine methyltransferase [Atopobium sp. oral taxon 810]|uniref:peptide chain release factor N(5)-glutamine methyltransferase n=1 Tax=Atopobium sp. oral taxon 810 TaxID=712158 RepID=UPI000397CFA0|nr:peptide chain release factor N(5)-glutamine methyltransferase [Atopobium sp. oral taxon 810]ERI05999.1 protein-(glutamine-N5) methyltransferase [Atopobium sp. oral taxon 810 str. F0209]